MSNIKAISGFDVHRITSGQVIIDLSTAVKELVDNSIDAHADQIEIIFKNYGIESIECSDNGDGISESDFESLAYKHYTSKINNFDDVSTVKTLGFRGEALSSLCGISKVVVMTTRSGPKAHKLTYDNKGKLLTKDIISRNKGTTIQISKLFYNLPVREKEFSKTIKRHFTKCISLLQSYSIINQNIKFAVYNITNTGKKNLIISTNKQNNILKNLLTIFGKSSTVGLAEINLLLDLNPFKEQLFKKFLAETPSLKELEYTIKIYGFISKNSFGCGRNSKDRQYIYINKRPVEYPLITKCVNEIYRSFNNVQYPVIILDFEISPTFVDVNVTPDKRTVLLHNERFIIDLLKEKLIDYYDNQELQLPKTSLQQKELPQNVGIKSEENNSETVKTEQEQVIGTKEEQKKVVKENKWENEDEEAEEPANSEEEAEEVEVEEDDHEEAEEVVEDDDEEAEEKEEEKEEEAEGEEHQLNSRRTSRRTLKRARVNHSSLDVTDASSLMQESATPDSCSLAVEDNDKTYKKIKLDDYCNPEYRKHHEENLRNEQNAPEVLRVQVDGEETEFQAQVIDDNKLVILSDVNQNIEGGRNDEADDEKRIIDTEFEEENYHDLVRMEPTEELNIKSSVPLSQEEIDKNINYRSLVEKESQDKIEILSLDYRFDSVDMKKALRINELTALCSHDNDRSITKNNDLENLDDGANYLTLTVAKDDFNKMNIVGQFNLGFIIVTRMVDGKYDLFIVDQHASDEKYNFEMLQKTTVFKSQRLIAPQKVELSVIDELIVMDNIEIFEQNGFKLRVNEDNESGYKIELLSLPISKKTIFNLNDFNELIHLIREDGGFNKKNIKCSKIRSMFAMRACRKSIMIGKPLNKNTMRRIVKNLSVLDKPWNCPHGRPTMRHLVELKDWSSFSDDYEL